MRTKTVLFVVTLFLMQGYAMNMNVQDNVLNIESDELTTSGRSINVMPAISDAMQQYMLDNQDQNGDDDNDGDGMADDVDRDDDNDCIPDIWDSSRKDFDGDGINDADDLDDDGDGFNDSEEVTDTDNLTNIYDSDNDGYHDCSSMGMLQMNMLDVLVSVLADGSVTFSIDALELVTGENAEVFWNLVDTDDFLQLNNSTTSFVVSTTGSWGDSGTWNGLADGPYCLNVELSGSDASGNSDVLDSEQVCFTIDSSSNGGGSGSGTVDDCGNNTTGYLTHNFNFSEVSPAAQFVVLLTAECLMDNGQTYELVYQLWEEGASNPMQDNAGSGMWDSYDVDENWSIGWFNPVSNVITQGGNYSFKAMLYLGSTLIDEFTHDFCVNTNNVNCSDFNEEETEDVHPNCVGEYMPESMEADVAGRLDISMVTNSLFDPEYSGTDVIDTQFDLCWTPTNASVSMIAWLNATDVPYNGPTQGGEQIDRIVYSGYDINHQGHKSFFTSHTYSAMDTWNYTAQELDSGWYCWEGWLKVYDLEGGQGFVMTDLILWDATCFEVVEEEPQDNETELLGYCSFPTFGATPTELLPGENLTFTWTMDGDVSDQVYLALMSGWGAQYYFSSIEDNDGSHTITLPLNMNPNADYTIYIESAYDDSRTTLCWKYGSIDILEEDEDIIIDDIIDLFLNTTDERPRISMWYGKVNQHNEDGTWMTDPDGVAGAGLSTQWGSEGWGDRKLEYCQRFWPDTVEIRTSAPEEIVFYTRGNTDAYLTMKPVWLCVQDTDGDGILDPEDQDDDNDGWADIMEEVCFSDPLDANVVPEDLDGDGLCDVLQILLIEDYEPAEPGFCTNGEITGGNGLLGQTQFNEVVVIEMTGGNYQYQYEIQDTSNKLYSDIAQQPSNFDFIGYYEYYDIFISDSNGVFDMNGSFITIQARSDLSTSNLGVGHNIDSIGLRDANGNVIYATEVVAVELGDGLGSNNPAGRQDMILGPADQIPTAIGNNEASITVSFCPVDIASEDESVPGFGVMGALVALGAAMLVGRRSSTDDE